MKIYEKDGAVRLHAHVQPRASRTEITGVREDGIRVRLAAPPVEGEANAELEKFIAKLVGVAASHVRVVAGATSRRKTVVIENTSAAAVTQAIEKALKAGR